MYKSSKGQTLDTADMDDVHIERALAKAQQSGNKENETALLEEMKKRNEN